MKKLNTKKGTPLPFGTSPEGSFINFSIFCTDAEEMKLCLFNLDMTLLEEIVLDPLQHKTGDVWHIAVSGLQPPFYYAYKTTGEHLLSDPYAKSTSSDSKWGNKHTFLGAVNKIDDFDWENEVPLNIPINDLIIYEMHVRAFTAHRSSQVSHPGTFLGLIEKIPHLVNLGINAVELLPIQEFDESEYDLQNPFTHARLYNFWGYSTLNYFALTNRYATDNAPGIAIREFKTLVKELHKNGIEVILDIVFNHTGEGNEKGPVYSFKGLDNSVYYIHNEKHGYANYTGCGNTVNCNHPIVIKMILDTLRYWVIEMHVDGFRFDLTTIFFRGFSGEPLDTPPLITAITLDPILSKTKLIAEPWDAAGLYRLGKIYPEKTRWHDWNDQYRNAVRRFIKGTLGVKADFATSLCGSQNIFAQHSPTSSLNFVTCHDGFTLADLVSYNNKHNENNSENNRDGNSFNDSWNCGVEGPTKDPHILELRNRQMRNFHTVLMLSQGLPMLHMGDEYGHTKKGNNNTWCQDNDLTWFLWDQLNGREGFLRFYRLMIAFRKQQKLLRHGHFLTTRNIDWHGSQAGAPQWDIQDSLLAFTLKSPNSKEAIYAAFNAHDYEKEIHLPQSPTDNWFWVVNTANQSPLDFNEHPEKFPMKTGSFVMIPHSAIVLISIDGKDMAEDLG